MTGQLKIKTAVFGAPLSPSVVITASALWIGGAGNFALWQVVARLGLFQNPQGWAIAAALLLSISGATAVVLMALGGPRTCKPVLSVALVITALCAHFMSAYGVVIDPTMMTNILSTHTREAADLVGLRMLGVVLTLGVLPAALVWRTPIDSAPLRQPIRRAAWLGIALLVAILPIFAAFKPLSALMRNHKEVRYLIAPLNVAYASLTLALTSRSAHAGMVKPVGEDATPGPSFGAATKPVLLFLVVGETARSANFSLNGYPRDTNPELQKLGVFSFENVLSCGTSTAVSVPCMFSPLAHQSFNRHEAESEDLLDVISRAGLGVLWIDNQAGCKGVCDRVPTINASQNADPALCADGECYDEALLAQLEARINTLSAEKRARGVVVVMHQMGSHGPAYYKRSPPAHKRFTPECNSIDLQNCSREQLMNAYDNSIAYTDHVLASMVHWLGSQGKYADTALVYVSDHGESLGENNLYLHGMPTAIAPDVQRKVPWITWLSEDFIARRNLSAACLSRLRATPLSHNHYFHSVLGLLDIQTSARESRWDVYGGCAQ